MWIFDPTFVRWGFGSPLATTATCQVMDQPSVAWFSVIRDIWVLEFRCQRVPEWYNEVLNVLVGTPSSDSRQTRICAVGGRDDR